MSEMKSLTLNDKKYDGFVDPVARELAAASGVIISASGENISISDSNGGKLFGLNIYGKTTQAGTPTPDVPVDLVSVGDGGSITVAITGENDGQSMVIATPNGLPGIPVASGGNYTDANGQPWVCDEIDLARGVYVQRTERVDMGTLLWEYDYTNNRFLTNALDEKVKPGTRLTRLLTSVDYDCKYRGEHLTAWDNAIYVAGSTVYVHDDNYSTVEAFSTAMFGATLLYPFETPVETPLSKEEIAAYKSLHTYRGQTTVSNDASAHMELDYGMDTKKYIDSMIAGTVINATVE